MLTQTLEIPWSFRERKFENRNGNRGLICNHMREREREFWNEMEREREREQERGGFRERERMVYLKCEKK